MITTSKIRNQSTKVISLETVIKQRSEDTVQAEFTFPDVDESEADLARALWLSVLVQAATDARTESTKSCRQLERSQAMTWILEGMCDAHSDFAMVCSLAGLSLDVGRRMINRLLEDPTESAVDFRTLRKCSPKNRGL